MSQVSIIDIEGSQPQIPTQFNGNVGSSIPIANIEEIITANSTPIFFGSGNTHLLDFGLSNLALGSSMPDVTTGDNNCFYGLSVGESITDGSNSVAIGYQAYENAQNCSDNVAIGLRSMQNAIGLNANSCVAVGSLSLQSLLTGNDTVAVGYQSLGQIVDGGSNTCIGYRAGFNYTTTESNNILIGNSVEGDAGESNVTRIGGSQAKCFIDGITGVTVSNEQFVTINSVTGQLGISATGGGTVTDVLTANATPQFTGGATKTLDFSDAVAFNLGLGSAYPNLTTGQSNTSLGYFALRFVTSGNNNVSIGAGAGQNITSSNGNIGIGVSALSALTSGGGSSIAIGSQALQGNTSGPNIGIGGGAGTSVTTGIQNLLIGFSAGGNYTSSETGNLIIGNSGVLGESHVIRIGTSGSIGAQQNACYIAGIDGVNVGSVAKVLTMASDKLGTATITAGSGITVTPGANTITIAASSSSTLLTATVTLTSAQIKACRATPIEIIAAPGANKIIIPVTSSYYFLYAGTNQFTNGQIISTRYDNAGTTLTIFDHGISAASITAAATSITHSLITNSTSSIDTTNMINKHMVVLNTGASEITGNAANDNTLTVCISYYIMNV